MKIFKILFDVFRWIIYGVASYIAVDRVYRVVFPEKVETK